MFISPFPHLIPSLTPLRSSLRPMFSPLRDLRTLLEQRMLELVEKEKLVVGVFVVALFVLAFDLSLRKTVLCCVYTVH